VIVSSLASYSFTATADRTLVANFTSITYTINTSALPVAGGSTSGGGTFNSGDSVTVVATANAGYNFVNWTEGGGVVSTLASYSFTATADRTLVANFTPVSTITIAKLHISSPVTGGFTTAGDVKLSAPAPAGGITVLLSSSNSAVLRVPASVFVPAGQNVASFRVSTTKVKQPTSVIVTAVLGESQKSYTATVIPRK